MPRKCRLQKGSYLRLFRSKAIRQIQRGGADTHQNAACVAAGFLNDALFFQLDVGDLALVGLDQAQLALGHILQAGAAGDVAHLGGEVVVLALGGSQVGAGIVDLAVQLGNAGLAVHHAEDQPQQQRRGNNIQRHRGKLPGAVQPVLAAAYHAHLRLAGFQYGCRLACMK